MNLGQYIIENITDGVILRGVCAHDEEHGVLLVFSANAAEQIEAIVGKGIAESTLPAPPNANQPTGCDDSAMLDWLEENHVEFAEELHRIGWTSPTDAQWEKLKFFLRRIRCAIRAAMQAKQP